MRDAEKVSEVGDEELLEIVDDELDDQDEDIEVNETEHSDVSFDSGHLTQQYYIFINECCCRGNNVVSTDCIRVLSSYIIVMFYFLLMIVYLYVF